jgi:hypothetical protein
MSSTTNQLPTKMHQLQCVEEMRPSNCGSLLKDHKGMPKLEGNKVGFCRITLLLDPTSRYHKARRIFFMYLKAPLTFVK